ncbi:hypothetical protein [Singulisphaera sp. PoT]|uniref:hypothetical protein n=1 Tax=Singulisphaera sp. PoT TaxID=3411797 RepID=UPI003BF4C268
MGAEQTWFRCRYPLGIIERVKVVSFTKSYVEVEEGKTRYRANRNGQLGSYHPTYAEAAEAWLAVLGREIADARACLNASESKLAKANAWIEDHRTEVGHVSPD